MSDETTTRVLWVEGSPKGERSLSSACARAFLDGIGPDVEVDHLDVWDGSLPEFGAEAAYVKYAPLLGEPMTDEHHRLWARVEAEIARMRAADVLVVSSPMWNWSIPYRLKHWIDVVTQALQTFTIDRDGRFVGVVGVGKRAQLVLTRSNTYDGRVPSLVDHQQPFLEYVIGDMFGYDLLDSVVIEPTARWTQEEREAMWTEAVETAGAAGRSVLARD